MSEPAGDKNSEQCRGPGEEGELDWDPALFFSLVPYVIANKSMLQSGIMVVITPDRRQLKKLLTIGKCGSKIARNSDLDCPVGRQMAIKTLFLTKIF